MNRRDTIVVLGGGEDQINAYRSAHRMGLRVVGVDRNPDCLGAGIADDFLPITTRDPDAIMSAIDPARVAAVISPASDASQESVAELCARLRTPRQVSPRALRATVDKAWFHEVTTSLGLPQYRRWQAKDRRELLQMAGSARLPLVVKPNDSSGSKGLTYVSDAAELAEAIDLAFTSSPTGAAVIEEFVEGRHLTAECFLTDGAISLLCLTDRTLTGPPRFVTVTHVVPAAVPAELVDRITRDLSRICAALDHRHGPLNVDLILTESGLVHYVEMGARLGGNGMPALVANAFGIDTVTAALEVALGRRPRLVPKHSRVAMLHILAADHDGWLVSCPGRADVLRLPEARALEMFKQPGDRVQRYTQAGHKLGYLLLVADDHPSLHAAKAEAIYRLGLSLAATDPTGVLT